MDALGPQLSEALTTRGSRRRLAAGTPLFLEGELADRVAVITSGQLKLTTVSRSGTEAVLAVLGPGELIGEVSVFDCSPRSATAAALEPSEVVLIGRKQFEQFLAENGTAALVLVRQLCDRLRASNETRSALTGQSVAVRLAGLLSDLVDRHGKPADDGAFHIELPVSQVELGSWIGASREAVARALGELRSSGVLATSRRRILIYDLDALRRQAASD